MTRMTSTLSRLPLVAVVLAGGLGLSACATQQYVDDQIAAVNTRVSAVDAKASDAIQRADAANAAAAAAAGDARTANQRLDQLTSRVDGVEQRLAAARTPRN